MNCPLCRTPLVAENVKRLGRGPRLENYPAYFCDSCKVRFGRATYEAADPIQIETPRLITLRLITSPNLETIQWIDTNIQPHYLTTQKQDEPVRKIDLFTGSETTLYKITAPSKPSKDQKAWELDVDPALSYAYDKGLRFGLLHHLTDHGWIPDVALGDEDASRFEKLFGGIQRSDPLKYAALACSRQLPRPQRKIRTGLNEYSELETNTELFLGHIFRGGFEHSPWSQKLHLGTSCEGIDTSDYDVTRKIHDSK